MIIELVMVTEDTKAVVIYIYITHLSESAKHNKNYNEMLLHYLYQKSFPLEGLGGVS